ncbi:methyltransferase-like protein 27 [Amphiura filiformis]|uniref:methyltransferase-like protein 27 n=1 Tax=Amphiura filiformis TaxID=82378 RepID=UPI003B22420D
MEPAIGMLKQAQTKGIYCDYICDMIRPNEKTQVPDDTYDVVCVLGGVTFGCITPDSFPELIRITKKGGLFTFCMPEYTTKTQTIDPKFLQDNVEADLQALVAKGLCSKWSKEPVTFYDASQEHGKEKGDVYILIVA